MFSLYRFTFGLLLLDVLNFFYFHGRLYRNLNVKVIRYTLIIVVWHGSEHSRMNEKELRPNNHA